MNPDTSANLLPSLTLNLMGGATCNVGQTLCTLPPGASIESDPFSHYTVVATDADPLIDDAILTWQDLCDSGANNCNADAPPDQFATASSQSTLTCPPCADPGLCFTETCNEATNACERTCDSERSPDCEVTISDCIWSDVNGVDACQDQEDGPPFGVCPGGIDGVDVDLFLCDNGGVAVASTTTAGGGFYEFTQPSLDENCEPITQSWAIQVETVGSFVAQDDCADDTTDSDCDPTTGLTACTSVDPATDTTDLDCGFEPPGGELICRTPGFFGSHGGEEKRRSQNITQALIDEVGFLDVCGHVIDDTDVESQSSALEAMCVSVKGGQVLQLTRQLTALALNCVLSGFGGDCSGDAGLGMLFASCDDICDDGGPNMAVTECIKTVDCLNNGGTLVGGLCVEGVCSEDGEGCGHQAGGCAPNDCIGETGMCSVTGTACLTNEDCEQNSCEPFESCRRRDLCPEDSPFCFEPPGPAGSSNACKAATKNDCTVPFGDCDNL